MMLLYLVNNLLSPEAVQGSTSRNLFLFGNLCLRISQIIYLSKCFIGLIVWIADKNGNNMTIHLKHLDSRTERSFERKEYSVS